MEDVALAALKEEEGEEEEEEKVATTQRSILDCQRRLTKLTFSNIRRRRVSPPSGFTRLDLTVVSVQLEQLQRP